MELRRAGDIGPRSRHSEGRVDGLYICGAPLITTNRMRINILAVGAGLPMIYKFRDHAIGGGLIAYGASQPELFRRAAGVVDRILRGAKPAEIPVEQPTKFDLIVNLDHRQALGLTIPSTLLARADEVIE